MTIHEMVRAIHPLALSILAPCGNKQVVAIEIQTSRVRAILADPPTPPTRLKPTT